MPKDPLAMKMQNKIADKRKYEMETPRREIARMRINNVKG